MCKHATLGIRDANAQALADAPRQSGEELSDSGPMVVNDDVLSPSLFNDYYASIFSFNEDSINDATFQNMPPSFKRHWDDDSLSSRNSEANSHTFEISGISSLDHTSLVFDDDLPSLGLGDVPLCWKMTLYLAAD